MKRAFTLIELLVVVTIIVVLLALLTPAVDKAVEAAMRVKCASQLRIIHGSSRLYADAHRHAFFISRFRAVPHGFNAIHAENNDRQFRALPGDSTVNWIEALSTVGLTLGPQRSANDGTGGTFKYRLPAPLWDCPSSSAKSYVSTTYKAMAVRYPFLGGTDRWYNTSDGVRPSRSPVRVTRSEGHWVLAADFTYKTGNVWNANHAAYPGARPEGGNQVWVDGSVEWVEFDRMAFITGWNDTEVPFFAQSDLGEGGLSPVMRATAFK